MSHAVVTAAEGAVWESALLEAAARDPSGFDVVRRCVDVLELMAVCESGQAKVALVDARLRGFDVLCQERLTASGVATVAVLGSAREADEAQVRAAGVGHVVDSEDGWEVVRSVLALALADLGASGDGAVPDRGLADPRTTGARSEVSAEPGSRHGGPGPTAGSDELEWQAGPDVGRVGVPGRVIVVWGPTGAPGRTTVAVNLADELSSLGRQVLLIDADVYGGVVAATIGLVEESPGLIAACRQAQSRVLDPQTLAALAWQVRPGLRVLTGPSRADRWPELRPAAVSELIGVARSLADFIVLDVAFCLETDEELSFDTMAPRRNGVTLACLDAADDVLAVGAGDPVGLLRLVRGLDDLAAVEVSGAVSVVVNRVRSDVVAGEPTTEIRTALQRFAGCAPAAYLPWDPVAAGAAALGGRTLGEVAAGSPLHVAVAALAAALAGVEPGERSGRRRRGRRRAGASSRSRAPVPSAVSGPRGEPDGG